VSTVVLAGNKLRAERVRELMAALATQKTVEDLADCGLRKGCKRCVRLCPGSLACGSCASLATTSLPLP